MGAVHMGGAAPPHAALPSHTRHTCARAKEEDREKAGRATAACTAAVRLCVRLSYQFGAPLVRGEVSGATPLLLAAQEGRACGGDQDAGGAGSGH